ncbi:MAG TPA: hypothetical protein VFZ09_25155 [Archangium sp.]|uniref:hypothetical protein n=1 Tax=Archangium sp. TaxID=1872627 RepID=UPI002E355EA2|nr:hypothetical protein [Archangium sp.]HEX5749542.1 hypothetical protein [Archangium sp.]
MSTSTPRWLNPATLWDATVQDDPVKRGAPLLLRFVSERFMDDLGSRLKALPAPDLSALVARPENSEALKLYQPVHGRYYLVMARLVSSPDVDTDYLPDSGLDEQVGFVLRRLRADGGEEAWVSPPRDDVEPSWLEVPGGGAEALAPDEVPTPVFPLTFGPRERRRRLLVGSVPTGATGRFVAAEPPGSGLYALRFVLHRTGEGPLPPPVLSDRSEAFLLADFADPQAPKRPLPPEAQAAR